ncbi:MAG: histidine kinase dimerization/phosphoacceptor domain -containing protein [Treponemataceae bacterium]
MSNKKTSEQDRKAFDMLLSDLVERLLSLSDDPGRSSDFMAEELRALVGAKTVLVFLCRTETHPDKHRLASVYPERRRPLADDGGLERLLELSHYRNEPRVIEKNDTSEEADILAEKGISLSMIIPLVYGKERVGAILLLDLLDRGTVEKALETIQRLSSVFALILRNADLYANMQEKVVVRTRALEESLREKEVLLREVHHRVKNNLQIVLSFLYLKASGPVGEETRQILQESQARVHAMAMVHEEIYRSGDFAEINVAEYVIRIANAVMSAFCPTVKREFKEEGPIRLEVNEAIPCGLIVSELVMNAAKHAFLKRDGGRLDITIGTREQEGFIEIKDDGPGFPLKIGEKQSEGGIGLTIVESLLDQIHGRLEMSPAGSPGARAVLHFPLRSATIKEWTSPSSKTND